MSYSGQSRRWIPWRLDHPEELARYIAPTTVKSLVAQRADGTPGGLPGPNATDSRTHLAQECFDTLCHVGIRYADEEFGNGLVQLIRTPWDVLWQPRLGNCLDLSLVFASACLVARLCPIVVIIRKDDQSHALVLIDTDNRDDDAPTLWQPDELTAVPKQVLWQLKSDDQAPGRYLPIDVARLVTSTDTLEATFAESVEHGYALLSNGEWDWTVGVDIASTFDPEQAILTGEAPSSDLLEDAYSGSPRYQDLAQGSTLKLLDPRRSIVRYARRPEYTTAMDAITRAEPGLHLIIVSGNGGTGKTRMAAQIASELAAQGWLAGFLPNKAATTPEQREWLTHTTTPLFMVIDYPEAQEILRSPDRNDDLSRPIGAILKDRPQGTATYVMLTTRQGLRNADGTTPQWWADARDNFGVEPMNIPMPSRIQSPTLLYRRALDGFRTALGRTDDVPTYDPGASRPLETMLLAWAALQPDAPTQQPTTEQLFNQVTEHELGYWAKAYADRYRHDTADTKRPKYTVFGAPAIKPESVRELATCLSLFRPNKARLNHVLKMVPALRCATQSVTRLRLSQVLNYLVASDDNIVIQPDRIGEFLLVNEISPLLTDEGRPVPKMLHRWFSRANATELLNALLVITRINETNRAAAERITLAIFNDDPTRLETFFWVANTIGGPCARTLDYIAGSTPERVPRDPGLELARRVPITGSYLRVFADAILKHYGDVSVELSPQHVLALIEQSVRRSQTRDESSIPDALHDAQEAVFESARLLANTTIEQAPDLWAIRAGSLNNLANRLSDAGQRSQALDTATEATNLYRQLAAANPAAFLPDLAMSLNNLAVMLSDAGQRSQALDTATEATNLYRQLAAANPDAFLPNPTSPVR